MPIVKTTLALAAIAVVGLLSAGSASAQETPIELVNESGGHCNGCLVPAFGTVTTNSHLFGFEFQVSACTDSWTLELNEDGSGTIAVISQTGSGCNSNNCTTEGEQRHIIYNVGETAASVGHMGIRFCFVINESELHCDAEVSFSETAQSHVYRITAVDEPCGWGEISGTWQTAGSGFEIVHQ